MFWFLLIGIIAGWLAGNILEGGGFGFFGNLVVGVIGSFVGGFLFRVVGLSARGKIAEIVMATVGAVVLLLIIQHFR